MLKSLPHSKRSVNLNQCCCYEPYEKPWEHFLTDKTAQGVKLPTDKPREPAFIPGTYLVEGED